MVYALGKAVSEPRTDYGEKDGFCPHGLCEGSMLSQGINTCDGGYDMLHELERRLANLMNHVHSLAATVAPLAQVWVPSMVPWLPDGCDPQLSTEGCPFWCSPELKEFRETSSSFTFPRGRGLPGRVWATGSVEIIQDLCEMPEQNCPRKHMVELLEKSGVTGAVCFPVYAGGWAPVAFVEVFMHKSCISVVDILSGINAALLASGLDITPPEEYMRRLLEHQATPCATTFETVAQRRLQRMRARAKAAGLDWDKECKSMEDLLTSSTETVNHDRSTCASAPAECSLISKSRAEEQKEIAGPPSEKKTKTQPLRAKVSLTDLTVLHYECESNDSDMTL